MNPYSFPAAIVASVIIVIVIAIGRRLAREENETGIEPKAATPFIFTCAGLGAILYYFSETTPFLYNLTSDLIGALIGLGAAYFAPRILHSLTKGRNQSPK